MAIEAAFLDMMPSTVTIFNKLSQDSYGKPTFAASGTAVRCRVEDDVNKSLGPTEEMIIDGGTVYFYGVVTVEVNDKVVLPNGAVMMVKQITTYDDQSGTHHTEIKFG